MDQYTRYHGSSSSEVEKNPTLGAAPVVKDVQATGAAVASANPPSRSGAVAPGDTIRGIERLDSNRESRKETSNEPHTESSEYTGESTLTQERKRQALIRDLVSKGIGRGK